MRVEDWLGKDNKIGLDIWHKKYQWNDETFDEWLDRVSGNNDTIKELIKSKKFLFAGRILSNRGLNNLGKKITYSNCYVMAQPEDNIESIFDCARGLARTFSYGGGCGIDISKLAPKGAIVNNAAKETSGAISFMDLYSMTTELIGQNGRRGALMISLDCHHPDIEDFITIKSDLDKVTKANISIRVTDDFLQAVVDNADFKLEFTREETGEKIEKIVNASEIFDKFAYMNWDYAEPAFLFWDRIKNYNLLGNDENFEYAGVNPCLTGDTLIETTKGAIPIKDLVGTTPDVYCMDKHGNLTIQTVSKVWLTRKEASIVKITTPKGQLKCTPDHKIHTKNRGWVCASELRKGDKLTGLNRSMKDELHIAVALSGTKYIPEHRFVASYYHNIQNKDMHHLDGDTFNNSIDNLEVLEHGEHSKISNTGRQIESLRDEKGRYVCKPIKKKRVSINQGAKVGSNWFVQNIEYLNEKEDVYDMTVPEYHNFVANRIVVHNCAEEPLPAGGSCLLGAINLAEFVLNPFTHSAQFDFLSFEKTVKDSIYALNEVLDEGLPLHPLAIQRETVRDWRQIGLGIMGLADMLIKMGITYGSEESLKLCDEIGNTMALYAISASSKLSINNGSYPKFNKEKVKESEFYKAHAKDFELTGLRNSQLLTIAPTGTISTMLGVSGGIEPIFANYYTRKTESLHGEDVYYKIFTPIAWEYLQTHGYGEDENKLPEYFVISQDIPYRKRIDMQAIWQNHIDASISSTVNLPNFATVDDVKDLYLYAWKKGLKGITVYRDGCKRSGILLTDTNAIDTTKETPKPTKTLARGTVLSVSDDLLGAKRKLQTGCGSVHFEAYFDELTGEPMETFVNVGSSGSCERNLQLISRLMSLALRAGVSVEDIIDQCKSIKPCTAYVSRTNKKHDTSKGFSCPSAIGYALEDLCEKIKERCFADFDLEDNYAKPFTISSTAIREEDKIVKIGADGQMITKNPDYICPECGEPLVFEGGCNQCKVCGYSKCD